MSFCHALLIVLQVWVFLFLFVYGVVSAQPFVYFCIIGGQLCKKVRNFDVVVDGFLIFLFGF